MSFLSKVEATEIVPSLVQKIIDWLDASMREAKESGVDLPLITIADLRVIENTFHVTIESFLNTLQNELALGRKRINYIDDFIGNLISAMPPTLGNRYRERLRPYVTVQ